MVSIRFLQKRRFLLVYELEECDFDLIHFLLKLTEKYGMKWTGSYAFLKSNKAGYKYAGYISDRVGIGEPFAYFRKVDGFWEIENNFYVSINGLAIRAREDSL